jgi:hypothetical protein
MVAVGMRLSADEEEEDETGSRLDVLKIDEVLHALLTLPPLLRRRATCFSDASARSSFS